MHTTLIVALLVLLGSSHCRSDAVVQLNVNRPFNDMNEKFISFSIKPEDLYRALDGTHRRELTRMAALLDNSYIKFLDDYNFASNAEPPLRTTNRIIWRGFNRWTSAVNWTMIAPVPYQPETWNPLQALKILNQTHMLGVSDCLWQLGTDFGSSHAADYVADLKTMNLMVDTFSPYVNNWQVIGADVSAGSSAEETRRYIDMSKHLNTAFGWTQSIKLAPSHNTGSYIHEKDPALQMLLKKKVPVWLSLPDMPRNKHMTRQSNYLSKDCANDGLRWAKTLGDAASMGFDVIFKRIHNGDWEHPDFSFYVTAIFKKVMGSRVFPARPLNVFSPSNKLYTHCANDVSGGLAFMLVNSDDEPMQITIRSVTKLTLTAVWQYTLTARKGACMLNNNKLALNGTFRPEVKRLASGQSIQLETPAKSVSFWVLPDVELEHCQYTEVSADDEDELDSLPAETVDAEEQQLTSGDRLLRELIYETSLQHSPVARSRKRRFVLEDASAEKPTHGNLWENFGLTEKTITKRENVPTERRTAALDWFKQWFSNSFNADNLELPLLKRHARSTDNLFASSIFGTRTPITRKIFEIKKPERNTKPLFDMEEFDEEEFFKKINEQTEPPYIRLPEGDVHLKHIATPDGEDVNEEEARTEDKGKGRKQKVGKQRSQHNSREIVSEMKPLRLLPTEFYESLPQMLQPAAEQKLNIGATLNSLLFPEPFSKKEATKESAKTLEKSTNSEPSTGKKTTKTKKSAKQDAQQLFARDFMRAQRELSKTFPNDFALKASNENLNLKQAISDDDALDVMDIDESVEVASDTSLDVSEEAENQSTQYNRRNFNYFGENFDNFFGLGNQKKAQANAEEIKKEMEAEKVASVEETPWWELSHLRSKRSLYWNLPNEDFETNMISKTDDYNVPLGRAILPEQLATAYKYEVVQQDNKLPQQPAEQHESLPHKLVSTVKAKVTALFDMVSEHVGSWYRTIARHADARDAKGATAVANSIA